GLSHTANTVSATPILDIWAPCGPTLTSQPVSVSICSADAATFAVTVAAGGGPFTYQWEVSAAGGGTWTALTNGEISGVGTVSGAATDTLAIADAQVSGNAFHCIVMNGCGSATSAAATLTISTLLGDVDCNCMVDLSDLAVVLGHFGVLSGATRQDG